MDYHSMKRKELQALCKKHGVPANLTNLEMANKLASLLSKEVDNKPTARLRSCLKNVSEPASESGSDGARECKKVKFSPQNDTVLVVNVDSDDEEDEVNRVTRRTSMARSVAKKGQDLDGNVNNAKSHVEVVEKPVRATRSGRGRNVDAGAVVELPAETKKRKGEQKSDCVEVEDKSGDKPISVMENPVRATRSRSQKVPDRGADSAVLPMAATKRSKGGDNPPQAAGLSDESANQRVEVEETKELARRSLRSRVAAGKKNQKDANDVTVDLSDDPANQRAGAEEAPEPTVRSLRSRVAAGKKNQNDADDAVVYLSEETQEPKARSLRSRGAAGKKNQKDAKDGVVDIPDDPADQRNVVEETQEPTVRSLRSRGAAGKKNQKDAKDGVVDLPGDPADQRAVAEGTQEPTVRSLRSRVAAGKQSHEDEQDVIVAKENKNDRSLRQRNVKASDETSLCNGHGVNGEITEPEKAFRRSKRTREEKGVKPQQNQGKDEVGGKSTIASSPSPEVENVSVVTSETIDEPVRRVGRNGIKHQSVKPPTEDLQSDEGKVSNEIKTLPPRKSVRKNVSNGQNFTANDMERSKVSSRRKSVAICDRINNTAEDTEHNEPKKRRRDPTIEQGRPMTKGSPDVKKPSRRSVHTGAKKEAVQAVAGASNIVDRKKEPSKSEVPNPEGKPFLDSSVAMKESPTIGEQDPTSGIAECESNPVLDSRTVCDETTSTKKSNHSEKSKGNLRVSSDMCDTLEMVNAPQVPAENLLLEQKDSTDGVNLDLLESLCGERELCDSKTIADTESGFESEADEGFLQVTCGDDGQLPIDRLDLGANSVDSTDVAKDIGRNEILVEEEKRESSYNGLSNQSLFQEEKKFSNHVIEVNQDLLQSLSQIGEVSDTKNIAQTEPVLEAEKEVVVDEVFRQVTSANNCEFQIDILDNGAASVDSMNIVKAVGRDEILVEDEKPESGYNESHLGVDEVNQELLESRSEEGKVSDTKNITQTESGIEAEAQEEVFVDEVLPQITYADENGFQIDGPETASRAYSVDTVNMVKDVGRNEIPAEEEKLESSYNESYLGVHEFKASSPKDIDNAGQSNQSLFAKEKNFSNRVNEVNQDLLESLSQEGEDSDAKNIARTGSGIQAVAEKDVFVNEGFPQVTLADDSECLIDRLEIGANSVDSTDVAKHVGSNDMLAAEEILDCNYSEHSLEVHADEAAIQSNQSLLDVEKIDAATAEDTEPHGYSENITDIGGEHCAPVSNMEGIVPNTVNKIEADEGTQYSADKVLVDLNDMEIIIPCKVNYMEVKESKEASSGSEELLAKDISVFKSPLVTDSLWSKKEVANCNNDQASSSKNKFSVDAMSICYPRSSNIDTRSGRMVENIEEKVTSSPSMKLVSVFDEDTNICSSRLLVDVEKENNVPASDIQRISQEEMHNGTSEGICEDLSIGYDTSEAAEVVEKVLLEDLDVNGSVHTGCSREEPTTPNLKQKLTESEFSLQDDRVLENIEVPDLSATALVPGIDSGSPITSAHCSTGKVRSSAPNCQGNVNNIEKKEHLTSHTSDTDCISEGNVVASAERENKLEGLFSEKAIHPVGEEVDNEGVLERGSMSFEIDWPCNTDEIEERNKSELSDAKTSSVNILRNADEKSLVVNPKMTILSGNSVEYDNCNEHDYGLGSIFSTPETKSHPIDDDNCSKRAEYSGKDVEQNDSECVKNCGLESFISTPETKSHTIDSNNCSNRPEYSGKDVEQNECITDVHVTDAGNICQVSVTTTSFPEDHAKSTLCVDNEMMLTSEHNPMEDDNGSVQAKEMRYSCKHNPTEDDVLLDHELKTLFATPAGSISANDVHSDNEMRSSSKHNPAEDDSLLDHGLKMLFATPAGRMPANDVHTDNEMSSSSKHNPAEDDGLLGDHGLKTLFSTPAGSILANDVHSDNEMRSSSKHNPAEDDGLLGHELKTLFATPACSIHSNRKMMFSSEHNAMKDSNESVQSRTGNNMDRSTEVMLSSEDYSMENDNECADHGLRTLFATPESKPHCSQEFSCNETAIDEVTKEEDPVPGNMKIGKLNLEESQPVSGLEEKEDEPTYGGSSHSEDHPAYGRLTYKEALLAGVKNSEGLSMQGTSLTEGREENMLLAVTSSEKSTDKSEYSKDAVKPMEAVESFEVKSADPYLGSELNPSYPTCHISEDMFSTETRLVVDGYAITKDGDVGKKDNYSDVGKYEIVPVLDKNFASDWMEDEKAVHQAPEVQFSDWSDRKSEMGLSSSAELRELKEVDQDSLFEDSVLKVSSPVSVEYSVRGGNATSEEKSVEDLNVEDSGEPNASDASHGFNVEENANESEGLLFGNKEVRVFNDACLDGGSNEYRELQKSAQASMLEDSNPAENDDSVVELSLGLACSDEQVCRATSKNSLEEEIFTSWGINMFSGDEIMPSTSAISNAHLTCNGSDVSSATSEKTGEIVSEVENVAEPDDHESEDSVLKCSSLVSVEYSAIGGNATSFAEKSLEDLNVEDTGEPRASDASHDFNVENATERKVLLSGNKEACVSGTGSTPHKLLHGSETNSAEEVRVCNTAFVDGGSNEYIELQNSAKASMLEDSNGAENEDSFADMSSGLACSDGKIGRETSKISLEEGIFTSWAMDMFRSEMENVAEPDDHDFVSVEIDQSVQVELSGSYEQDDIRTQVSDTVANENAGSELLIVGEASAEVEVRDSEYLAEAPTEREIVVEEVKDHCEPLLVSNALMEEGALDMNPMMSTGSALAEDKPVENANAIHDVVENDHDLVSEEVDASLKVEHAQEAILPQVSDSGVYGNAASDHLRVEEISAEAKVRNEHSEPLLVSNALLEKPALEMKSTKSSSSAIAGAAVEDNAQKWEPCSELVKLKKSLGVATRLLNTTTSTKRREPIKSLGQGTPKKQISFDMKENAPASVKRNNAGSIQPKSTVKRRALGDIPNQ